MTLSLDAKEVLAHLNEMGYRNISAEQLKEFMKDLRKLIKYEERIGVIPPSYENVEKAVQGRFESLHKALTVSFRAKTKMNDCKVPVENRRPQTKNPARQRAKSMSRSPPRNALKKKKVQPAKENIRNASPKNKFTRMWIRPKSARTPSSARKTNDPVQLYQFYKDEWRRFKQNLPGENDHADLRWNIRHKLLGA